MPAIGGAAGVGHCMRSHNASRHNAYVQPDFGGHDAHFDGRVLYRLHLDMSLRVPEGALLSVIENCKENSPSDIGDNNRTSCLRTEISVFLHDAGVGTVPPARLADAGVGLPDPTAFPVESEIACRHVRPISEVRCAERSGAPSSCICNR